MPSILLYSLDSFVAALGVGLLECSKITKRKLILAFATCDWIATFAGASLRPAMAHLHSGALASFFVPMIIAVVALAVLTHGRQLPARLMWIPFLLSLDNFLAGLFDGSVHGLESSLIAGALSGLLAWSGFEMARVAGSFFSQRVALVASVGLTIIAFVFLS
jgi:putative Mn2+ efflux pump MntP